MKSLLKLIGAALLCFVGGYALAYLVVCDACFKIFRMIRYGFLKVMSTVLRLFKPNRHLVEVWNSYMLRIMDGDSKVTTKINGLLLY